MRTNEAATPLDRLLLHLSPSDPKATVLSDYPEPQRFIQPEEARAIEDGAFGLLAERLGSSTPHLEYRDAFGQWKPVAVDEVRGMMTSHLKGAMQRDYDGGLLGVEVLTYEGLPIREGSRRHVLADIDWMVNIAVIVLDRYGDGVRLPNATHNGFVFPQRKRTESRQSSLFIRQKR